MGLFGSKKLKEKKVKVFIVEDSKVYAAQLEHFLTQKFADKIEVVTFPVAEVMDVKLENHKLPDIIVMDYILNARFDDAESGIEAMKRIGESYPGIELVLHSSQESLYSQTASEHLNKYHFIPKTQEGMEKIAALIEVLSKS